MGQLEPKKQPERPPSIGAPVIIVGVLAILGALWLLRLVTGLVFTGVKLALIGIVVYAAVRLAMGPREKR